METVFWQVSAIILSKVILFYGNQAFAAYQLGIQAEEITEMPAIGFSTASTTLAARAIGMQDEELRKVYFKEQLKVGVFISSITSVLLIFPPAVLYDSDDGQTGTAGHRCCICVRYGIHPDTSEFVQDLQWNHQSYGV